MNESSYNFLNDPIIFVEAVTVNRSLPIHSMAKWQFPHNQLNSVLNQVLISHSVNLTLKVIALGHLSKLPQWVTRAVFPLYLQTCSFCLSLLSITRLICNLRFFLMILSWKMTVKKATCESNEAIKEKHPFLFFHLFNQT